MQIEIVTEEGAVEALAGDWRQLQAACGITSFTGYDQFAAWWRHMGRPAGMRPHIIMGRIDGRLVALLPLVVANRKGIRILHGFAKEAFFPCDVLAESSDHAAPLWDAARRSPHYDFAAMGYVDCASPSGRALDVFSCKRDPQNAPYTGISWTNYDEWLKSLQNSLRRSFQRRAKRLDEKGSVEYRALTEEAAIMPIVTAMLRQKTARTAARGKGGLYDKPGVEEFFRDWIVTAIKAKQFVLFTLSVNGQVIACDFIFTCAKRMESYFTTYDPEWKRFSPGTLLMVHGIRWAIENGYTEIDYMHGDTANKLQFATGGRTLVEYTFSNSPQGAVKCAVFVGLRTLKQKIDALRQFRHKKAPAEVKSDD